MFEKPLKKSEKEKYIINTSNNQTNKHTENAYACCTFFMIHNTYFYER